MSPRWRKALKVGLGFAALGSGILGGMVAYAALTLPNVDDIGRTTGSIKLIDRNGKMIAEVGRNLRSRTSVTLDQIAPVLRDSTLAAEDRDFYNEGAFSVSRVLKALVVDVILRRPAQGASTITQQLTDQAFFGGSKEKSAMRKLREALLANQLASKYTKDEILEKYLNIIYYGENAYGIEDASLRYFGKHASALDLQEASLLAGLPEAPSFNDPIKNPQAAYARQHYVLDGLVKIGKVSQADADAVDPLVGGSTPTPEQLAAQPVIQQRLLTDLGHGKLPSGGSAPHFVQYIQDQLDRDPYNVDLAAVDGDLTVQTTLDLDIQARADLAVKNGVKQLSNRNANNGALIMIDARTGDIRAMVGSADFGNADIAGQFNVVTAQRRPGSSFKPYVYETGFKNNKFKPGTLLDDTKAESEKLGVTDFDNRYQGRITAAQALLQSRNIATEQAMVIAGFDNVISFARSLGISTDLADNASTGIGTSSVRMIEHAAAYAAFANGGQRIQSRGITKITAANGDVLFDQERPAGLGNVMTAAEADSINQILERYQDQWSLPFKYRIAGKSGTTDNFVDAVYMAYSPDWVVGTWAGHTSSSHPGEIGMKQVFGTDEAKAIAVPFVNSLTKPTPFTRVRGALTTNICDQNGGEFACPTSTPAPTPSPTPSAAPTPPPAATPTAVPTPPPVKSPSSILSLPPLLGTPPPPPCTPSTPPATPNPSCP